MNKLFTTLILMLVLLLGSRIACVAQTATRPSGSGTSGDPYQIASLENLYWIAASNAVVPSPNQAIRWAAYYQQTSNIDASTTSGWFSGAGWRPIGYDDGTHSGIPFSGSYDGQGHTISGIYINSSTINIYEGFVGFISSGGTVSNLGLTSVNITGVYCTGGIAGGNDGTISNCYCSGSVTANNENGWGGGIVGYIMGTVSQCYFNGTVSGTGTMFGGVVAASEGTILTCYNTGSVTGSNYVGGIVGYSLGLVSNCYNKGTISGANEIGGIAGENDNTINYCFNIGSVSGSGSNIGAIAGADGGGGTFYTSNLWDSESSGITQGAGWTTPDPSGIAGKTTAQMKCAGTYTTTGWDFTLSGDIWGINGNDNNGYPWLRLEGYTSSNIWLGTNSTIWKTATNWSEGSVPTSNTNVIIPNVSNDPIISTTTSADCSNLSVEATGSLTIQSSASSTGSLIVSGTATGNVNAERYLSGSAWHVVSPIVFGGGINSFLTNSANSIATKDINSVTNYGMMDYNETTNAWKSYFTTSTLGSLTSGQGYGLRRSSDGVVTFTGALFTGTKTVTLAKAGEGWNCMGNPYTSAIGMNSSAGTAENFLTKNSGSLESSYACVYVWDPTSSTYQILGNLPGGLSSERSLVQDYLQAGQGFFVKAATSTSTISFTSAMQSAQLGTTFKSATTAWSTFTLKVSAGQTSASTIVAFNEKMTKGLDPTYDAGLLRGSNGLSLYTRLVDDNGVDFAIQCLPEKGMENLVVPVGLDSKAGGEIRFSAASTGFSTGSSIILEDRTAKVYTDLSSGGEYVVTLSANSSGTGRFYIHTSNITTGASSLLPAAVFSLKAYPGNGLIWIDGQVSNSAKAYLFNIGGSALGEFNLQEGNRNTVPATGLSSGVYILKVTDGKDAFTTKLVINSNR